MGPGTVDAEAESDGAVFVAKDGEPPSKLLIRAVPASGSENEMLNAAEKAWAVHLPALKAKHPGAKILSANWGDSGRNQIFGTAFDVGERERLITGYLVVGEKLFQVELTGRTNEGRRILGSIISAAEEAK